jgi:hypothetical protein
MRGKKDRIARIQAVEDEYRVIKLAIAILRAQLAGDPTLLSARGLERRSFERSVQNLEATFVIRLFAEFETGLREAWRRAWKRASRPATAQLMRTIAGRCGITGDWFNAADAVRKYRNALIHEEDESATPIPALTAGQSLRRFLSRLPWRY